jgi:hypothetical protein
MDNPGVTESWPRRVWHVTRTLPLQAARSPKCGGGSLVMSKPRMRPVQEHLRKANFHPGSPRTGAHRWSRRRSHPLLRTPGSGCGCADRHPAASPGGPSVAGAGSTDQIRCCRGSVPGRRARPSRPSRIRPRLTTLSAPRSRPWVSSCFPPAWLRDYPTNAGELLIGIARLVPIVGHPDVKAILREGVRPVFLRRLTYLSTLREHGLEFL